MSEQCFRETKTSFFNWRQFASPIPKSKVTNQVLCTIVQQRSRTHLSIMRALSRVSFSNKFNKNSICRQSVALLLSDYSGNAYIWILMNRWPLKCPIKLLKNWVFFFETTKWIKTNNKSHSLFESFPVFQDPLRDANGIALCLGNVFLMRHGKRFFNLFEDFLPAFTVTEFAIFLLDA